MKNYAQVIKGFQDYQPHKDRNTYETRPITIWKLWKDILEELQMLPTVAAEPKKSPNGEPPQNHPHSLLKQIDYEMTATDTIILRSGLTAGEVSSILLALELQGHIQAVIGGYVRTVKTGKGQVITHV